MSFSSFGIFSVSESVPIPRSAPMAASAPIPAPVPVPAPEWWDTSEEENDF